MVKIYLSYQNLLAQKLTFFLYFEENILREVRKIYVSHNLDTLLSHIYEVLVPGQVN